MTKPPAMPDPQPAEVSDDDILTAGHRLAWRYKHSSDPSHSSTYTFNRACLLQFARAILALRPQSEPDELSPDFTDTARAALLWVLWHHQGGSSPVGQPIRYALGMGAHESLNAWQVSEAKRWAAITGSQTSEFHNMLRPQAVPIGRDDLKMLMSAAGYVHATAQEKADFINGFRNAEAHHGITAQAKGEQV